MSCGCGGGRYCGVGCTPQYLPAPGMGAMGSTSILGYTILHMPSDVTAEVTRLNPAFAATTLDINACAGITPNQKATWGLVYAAWTARASQHEMSESAFYFGLPFTAFHVNADWNEVEGFATQLAQWQAILKEAGCASSAPPEALPDTPEPNALPSAVKWGAAAVIAASVVYGIRLVLG